MPTSSETGIHPSSSYNLRSRPLPHTAAAGRKTARENKENANPGSVARGTRNAAKSSKIPLPGNNSRIPLPKSTRSSITASSKASVSQATKRTKVPDFEKLHKSWTKKFETGKAVAKKQCTQSEAFDLTRPGTHFKRAYFDGSVEKKEPRHLSRTGQNQNRATSRVRKDGFYGDEFEVDAGALNRILNGDGLEEEVERQPAPCSRATLAGTGMSGFSVRRVAARQTLGALPSRGVGRVNNSSNVSNGRDGDRKSFNRKSLMDEQKDAGLDFEASADALASILNNTGLKPSIGHAGFHTGGRQTIGGMSARNRQSGRFNPTTGRTSIYYQRPKNHDMSKVYSEFAKKTLSRLTLDGKANINNALIDSLLPDNRGSIYFKQGPDTSRKSEAMSVSKAPVIPPQSLARIATALTPGRVPKSQALRSGPATHKTPGTASRVPNLHYQDQKHRQDLSCSPALKDAARTGLTPARRLPTTPTTVGTSQKNVRWADVLSSPPADNNAAQQMTTKDVVAVLNFGDDGVDLVAPSTQSRLQEVEMLEAETAVNRQKLNEMEEIERQLEMEIARLHETEAVDPFLVDHQDQVPTKQTADYIEPVKLPKEANPETTTEEQFNPPTMDNALRNTAPEYQQFDLQSMDNALRNYAPSSKTTPEEQFNPSAIDNAFRNHASHPKTAPEEQFNPSAIDNAFRNHVSSDVSLTHQMPRTKPREHSELASMDHIPRGYVMNEVPSKHQVTKEAWGFERQSVTTNIEGNTASYAVSKDSRVPYGRPGENLNDVEALRENMQGLGLNSRMVSTQRGAESDHRAMIPGLPASNMLRLGVGSKSLAQESELFGNRGQNVGLLQQGTDADSMLFESTECFRGILPPFLPSSDHAAHTSTKISSLGITKPDIPEIYRPSSLQEQSSANLAGRWERPDVRGNVLQGASPLMSNAISAANQFLTTTSSGALSIKTSHLYKTNNPALTSLAPAGRSSSPVSMYGAHLYSKASDPVAANSAYPSMAPIHTPQPTRRRGMSTIRPLPGVHAMSTPLHSSATSHLPPPIPTPLAMRNSSLAQSSGIGQMYDGLSSYSMSSMVESPVQQPTSQHLGQHPSQVISSGSGRQPFSGSFASFSSDVHQRSQPLGRSYTTNMPSAEQPLSGPSTTMSQVVQSASQRIGHYPSQMMPSVENMQRYHASVAEQQPHQLDNQMRLGVPNQDTWQQPGSTNHASSNHLASFNHPTEHQPRLTNRATSHYPESANWATTHYPESTSQGTAYPEQGVPVKTGFTSQSSASAFQQRPAQVIPGHATSRGHMPELRGSLSLGDSLARSYLKHPGATSQQLASEKESVGQLFHHVLLDEECALYACRLRGRFTPEPSEPRPLNPIAKVLLQGDDMHFVPVKEGTGTFLVASPVGSAFSNFLTATR